MTDRPTKERPIIFSAPMIRTILAGTKAQTRRVAKFIPLEPSLNLGFSGLSACRYNSAAQTGPWVLASRGAGACWNDRTEPLGCPHGETGDRLWVREAWAVDRELDEVRRAREDVLASPAPGADGGPYYRADRAHENTGLRWRSPIHMPRWASRLTLEITGVRVERVQSITPDDVIAEGVARVPRCGCEVCSRLGVGQWCPADASAQIMEFAAAWGSINGKRPGCSWDANPWVWVLEFRRVEAA